MKKPVADALIDLLAVRDLNEITPNRLQAWQTAARTLVTPDPPKPIGDLISSEGD